MFAEAGNQYTKQFYLDLYPFDEDELLKNCMYSFWSEASHLKSFKIKAEQLFIFGSF